MATRSTSTTSSPPGTRAAAVEPHEGPTPAAPARKELTDGPSPGYAVPDRADDAPDWVQLGGTILEGGPGGKVVGYTRDGALTPTPDGPPDPTIMPAADAA